MFENVVIGVDGGDGGHDAIALAKELAPPNAALTLGNVYGIGSAGGRAAALAMPLQAEASAQLLARERTHAALDADAVSVYESSVGRGLHQLAEQRGADLLVIGSCRRGLLGRVLVGNDTIAALNGAPCAIAIAPAGYAATAHRLSALGVGCDGSAESEHALDAARELAARSGATIKALSVISLQSIPYGEPIPDNWPDIAKQLMDDELRRLRGLDDVEGDVSYGEPSEELASFGEGLDLLIVGSRSYGPLGRLFNGSTSNYLARRAHCPLLVLPRSAGRSSDAHLAEQAEVAVPSATSAR
jgi:nucleotide-binding universal stress UspA family protein